LIQTPGGNVDATEKIISILRQRLDDFRVIVPSWCKSAGTVISLSATRILFGVNSELGPIDPQWRTDHGQYPCELIAKDTAIAQHVRDFAQMQIDRMRQLATTLLMKTKTDPEIRDILNKISSSAGYQSHGAVIDFSEAQKLGLSAQFIEPNDNLWKQIWLLYCMYDYDTKAKNLGKIFEGNQYSIGRPK
jgi:membrane-bound ClpP family serine protease